MQVNGAVGCMYAVVGCKVCGCWVQVYGDFSHLQIQSNQNQVRCDDAATEANEPVGSTPEG